MGLVNSSADLQKSTVEIAEAAAAESMENTRVDRLLRIVGFNFDLKTAALAGNRYIGYEISDPLGHTQYEALTPALVEKAPDGTNIYGICGAIGFPHDTVLSSRTVLLPLPDIMLPKGWKWSAIAPSKQAGDTFPIFRLAFEWVFI